MIAHRLAPALALLALAGCRESAETPQTKAATPPVKTVAATEPLGAIVVASVDGVQVGGEPVDAALQSEVQWGTDEAAYRARVPADGSGVALRLDGVVPGRYGMVAVQPNTPPTVRDGEKAEGQSLPVLTPRGRGGWAASGGEGRRLPDWDAAAVTVGADGATVPLVLVQP